MNQILAARGVRHMARVHTEGEPAVDALPRCLAPEGRPQRDRLGEPARHDAVRTSRACQDMVLSREEGGGRRTRGRLPSCCSRTKKVNDVSPVRKQGSTRTSR